MPDNVLPAAGAVVALERIGNSTPPASADVLYLGKFGWGGYGTFNPLVRDGAGGMPMQFDVRTDAIFGAPNEVAASNEGSTAGIIPLLKAILRDLRARLPVLGQAAMAGSIPVAIASNQSPLSISGSAALQVGGSAAAAGPGSAGSTTLRVTTATEDQALLGATNSSAAANETANTGLNGLLKGIFAQLRGILSVSPTVLGTSTRAYAIANGVRQAFTATASSEFAFPTLGASREVRIAASARCWIRWGTSGSVADPEPSATCLVIEGGLPEVIQIPTGVNAWKVIRDSADGHIQMTPVA